MTFYLKTVAETFCVLFFSIFFFRSLSRDAAVNLHLAQYYVRLRQDCITAVELLLPETAANPDVAEFHITLAQCYMKLGALNKAVPHLEKVLNLQPDNQHVSQILNALKHAPKK